MSKAVPVILGIVVVGAAAALVLIEQMPNSSTYPSAPVTSTGTPPAATAGYTMAQVLTHATPANCWSAVNGSVYDLTSWIVEHPGGESAILSMCGTDSSAAFDAQHGSQREPISVLALYRIGVLIP